MLANFHQNSTIHNVRLDTQFTITPNASAEDSRISWAAKGLLWYILSRPKDWVVYTKQLAKIYNGNAKGNGRDAVLSLLNELKLAGYVKYSKTRNKLGRWSHRYDVYPLPVNGFQKMFPQPDQPDMDDPDLDDPCIIPSTDEPSTDLKDLPPQTPPKKAKNKSLRSEEEDSIYECLRETSLSSSEQKRLTKEFSDKEVQRALSISKTQPIKRSLMALLLHILRNPTDWSSDSKVKPLSINEQLALQHNEEIRKVYPEMASQNDIKIKDGKLTAIDKDGNLTHLSLKSDELKIDINISKKQLELAKSKR